MSKERARYYLDIIDIFIPLLFDARLTPTLERKREDGAQEGGRRGRERGKEREREREGRDMLRTFQKQKRAFE